MSEQQLADLVEHVDVDIIWETVRSALPDLLEQISAIDPELDRNE